MSNAIEKDILEMAQKLSEYDMSVFFNPLFKKSHIDTYEVKINADCVTLSKTFQYDDISFAHNIGDHIHDYHNPFLQNWNDNKGIYSRQRLWYVGFTFNYNGELKAHCVTNNEGKTYSVLIGDKKLFIDDGYWIDIEEFHAKVFQSMTVTKQQLFDLSFTSEVLKVFNIGD